MREESTDRIHDLKSFYEDEIYKMRKDFELRELSLKEKMQSSIQERIVMETTKVVSEVRKLKEEKEVLEERIRKSENRKRVSSSFNTSH